jgi:hypothetical protein
MFSSLHVRRQPIQILSLSDSASAMAHIHNRSFSSNADNSGPSDGSKPPIRPRPRPTAARGFEKFTREGKPKSPSVQEAKDDQTQSQTHAFTQKANVDESADKQERKPKPQPQLNDQKPKEHSPFQPSPHSPPPDLNALYNKLHVKSPPPGFEKYQRNKDGQQMQQRQASSSSSKQQAEQQNEDENGNGNANDTNSKDPRQQFQAWWERIRKNENAMQILAAITVVNAVIFMLARGDRSREISWNELTQLLQNDQIKNLEVVNSRTVRVHLKQDATSASASGDNQAISSTVSSHMHVSIGSVDAFEKNLEETQKMVGLSPAHYVSVIYTQVRYSSKSFFANLSLNFVFFFFDVFFRSFSVLFVVKCRSETGSWSS